MNSKSDACMESLLSLTTLLWIAVIPFSFFRSGYMNVALEQTEEYVDGQLKVSSCSMHLHCLCGR